MPNADVIGIIAADLAQGIVHPGDGRTGPIVLPLPMFRTANIPPQAAQHFAQQAGLPHPDIARLTAEAIVHTVETKGWAHIQQNELEKLRLAAAPEPAGRMTLPFKCAVCHNTLFRLNVDVNNPIVNGPHLLEQLSKLTTPCPHTPEPTA